MVFSNCKELPSNLPNVITIKRAETEVFRTHMYLGKIISYHIKFTLIGPSDKYKSLSLQVWKPLTSATFTGRAPDQHLEKVYYSL